MTRKARHLPSMTARAPIDRLVDEMVDRLAGSIRGHWTFDEALGAWEQILHDLQITKRSQEDLTKLAGDRYDEIIELGRPHENIPARFRTDTEDILACGVYDYLDSKFNLAYRAALSKASRLDLLAVADDSGYAIEVIDRRADPPQGGEPIVFTEADTERSMTPDADDTGEAASAADLFESADEFFVE